MSITTEQVQNLIRGEFEMSQNNFSQQIATLS